MAVDRYPTAAGKSPNVDVPQAMVTSIATTETRKVGLLPKKNVDQVSTAVDSTCITM